MNIYIVYDDIEEETRREIEGEEEEENRPPPLTLIQKTIKGIHVLTGNLYERVVHAQTNLQQIIALASHWINIPLYVRDKTTKRITFGNQLDEKKTARYAEIKAASTKIQRLLKENILLLNNVPLLDPNHGKLVSVYLLNLHTFDNTISIAIIINLTTSFFSSS
jgi:dynein heavy chain